MVDLRKRVRRWRGASSCAPAESKAPAVWPFCVTGPFGVVKFEKEKKDEKRRREEELQKLVCRMIASAEGGGGLLRTITKPTA